VNEALKAVQKASPRTVRRRRMIAIDEYVALVTHECSGKQHRVGITSTGKLAFFDHVNDSLGLEEQARAAGAMDASCACGALHRHWINARSYYLPSPFDDWRKRFYADRRKRQHAARVELDPLASMTARERYEKRVKETAREVFLGCEYRRGNHENHTRVVVCPRSEASVCVTYEAHMRKTPHGDEVRREVDTEVVLRVPLRWLTSCHRTGIGTINGMFVMDVIGKPRRDGSRLVRVVKQSRGYSLAVKTALLTKRGALRWL
jgi:hypothetical protein